MFEFDSSDSLREINNSHALRYSRHASLFFILTFTVMSSLVSAHLDSGFEQTAGPYLIDVGWTPAAPNAGESVLIAINVLDAATKRPVNLSSVWIRLDLKDQVNFAGTLALKKGSASLTYVFPKAGVWAVTIQADNHQASGELWVPGEPPTTETLAWMVAAVLAIAAGILGYKSWKTKRR